MGASIQHTKWLGPDQSSCSSSINTIMCDEELHNPNK